MVSTSFDPMISQVLLDAVFSGLQVIHRGLIPCDRARGVIRRQLRAAKRRPRYGGSVSYTHLRAHET